nr:hypothetical protein TgIb.0430 [Toxoplasma gondii RH]
MEGNIEAKTPNVLGPSHIALSPRQARWKTVPLSSSEHVPRSRISRRTSVSTFGHLSVTVTVTNRACQFLEPQSRIPGVDAAAFFAGVLRQQLKTGNIAGRRLILLTCFFLWFGCNGVFQEYSRTGSPGSRLNNSQPSHSIQNHSCTVDKEAVALLFKARESERLGGCPFDFSSAKCPRTCSTAGPGDTSLLAGLLPFFTFQNLYQIVPRGLDCIRLFYAKTVTSSAVYSIKRYHTGNFTAFVPFALLATAENVATLTGTAIPSEANTTQGLPPRHPSLKQDSPDWLGDDASFSVLNGNDTSTNDTRSGHRYIAYSPAERLPASALAEETRSKNTDDAKSPDTERVPVYEVRSASPSERPTKVNGGEESARKLQKGNLHHHRAFPRNAKQLQFTTDRVRHIVLTGSLRPSYVKGSAIDVTADVTQAGELDLGFDGDVFFSLYLKKEGPLGAATQPIPQSPTYRARAEKGTLVETMPSPSHHHRRPPITHTTNHILSIW